MLKYVDFLFFWAKFHDLSTWLNFFSISKFSFSMLLFRPVVNILIETLCCNLTC